ncbi:Flp family type IVb pilin [Pseudomonas sp. MYb185]|nr:Flp family type IVb pilin [Pseudomonas sp. MYb185]
MMESVRSFFKKEEGASAIEYALIAGLIAVAIIAGASTLGEGVGELFTEIATRLGLVEVDSP